MTLEQYEDSIDRASEILDAGFDNVDDYLEWQESQKEYYQELYMEERKLEG